MTSRRGPGLGHCSVAAGTAAARWPGSGCNRPARCRGSSPTRGERRQLLAERPGVLLAQVNLIRRAARTGTAPPRPPGRRPGHLPAQSSPSEPSPPPRASNWPADRLLATFSDARRNTADHTPELLLSPWMPVLARGRRQGNQCGNRHADSERSAPLSAVMAASLDGLARLGELGHHWLMTPWRCLYRRARHRGRPRTTLGTHLPKHGPDQGR